MSGKEDVALGSGSCGDACSGDSGKGNGSSRPPCHVPSGRKTYWRSASWSTSRTMLPQVNPESDKGASDATGNSDVQGWKASGPLTPRSRHSFKGRSCLPPLQPLAISRRSLDEWPKAGSDDIGEWPLPCTPSGRDPNNGGERLKLDLSNIKKNPEKNGGLAKREKIASFDKECSKVAEHVYLGGDAVARDKDILKQHGISHILNCVGFVCPEYFKADFVYRTLWLQDSPTEDITSILYDVFDYFEDVREQGGRVFVHCCQGVSRSTSLVIAYLMWREGQSFDDAFQYVKAARGIADPNMGFACQLLQCQKRVHAFPLSPSSLLRMYRIAPHSPYDPLHLVPKMLNDPSPSALDSRGAFIVHIPSAIYVWVGKNCDAIMERDARGAVCQIVRYERVQGPIIMIKEGEEPSYFWDAFSSLLPLMDKSSNCTNMVKPKCPGERKVDAYDVDYDIFQKATLGGFVPPLGSSGAEHENCLPVRESCWSVLRRKFASGNMKDFVSAFKCGVSTIYPDSFSVTIDHSSKREMNSSATSSSSSSPSSTSLSLSSSSSSSPYLSPDSVSSDSRVSSTLLPESADAAPLAKTCSDLASSTLSNFSNMSLLSSEVSPPSISTSSKYIDVNFSSFSSSQSTSSPSRKFPLSIAERRGSLSKCLKLPSPTDNSLEKSSPSSCLADKREFISVNENKYSPSESHNIQKEAHPSQECEQESSRMLPGLDICSGEATSINISGGPGENSSLGENEAPLANGTIHSCLASSDLLGPVVYQWPNLEKVASFDANHLNSRSAYIFVDTNASGGDIGNKMLYMWLGKFFQCDKSGSHLAELRNVGDVDEVDWRQARDDILTQLGLTTDSHIEIIRENEEPLEFITMLRCIQPSHS